MAVSLIPMVHMRGPISEVYCCCLPRLCWYDVGARRVFEVASGFVVVALVAFA